MSIQAHLSEFSNLANPIEDYEWSHVHDGKKYNHTLVISGLIHGNETGSLPAINEIINGLNAGKIEHGGKIIFTLGNPEAAVENVRFLESDLNRVFLDTTLDTHEANRARVLMPIFDLGDVLIDLHQTILDTNQPFYIFPWTQQSGRWAQAIKAATVCVDATPDPSKPILTQCADDYFRKQGKAAITIELGRKGFNESSYNVAKKAILNSMRIAESIAYGTSLKTIANREAQLTVYETTHRESHGPAHRKLRPGLVNFMEIKRGESLHAEGSPDIIAPHDGMILFPKYPPKGKALPKEIFRIVNPVES